MKERPDFTACIADSFDIQTQTLQSARLPELSMTAWTHTMDLAAKAIAALHVVNTKNSSKIKPKKP